MRQLWSLVSSKVMVVKVTVIYLTLMKSLHKNLINTMPKFLPMQVILWP